MVMCLKLLLPNDAAQKRHFGCLRVADQFPRPGDGREYSRTINGPLDSAQERAQQSQFSYVAQSGICDIGASVRSRPGVWRVSRSDQRIANKRFLLTVPVHGVLLVWSRGVGERATACLLSQPSQLGKFRREQKA